MSGDNGPTGIRGWLLGKAELSLADAEQYRSKWSWSFKPSQAASHDRLIARRRRLVERLGGNPDD